MALMVRLGAERREQALREPHVRPTLFASRALSGFVCIEPGGGWSSNARALPPSVVRKGVEPASAGRRQAQVR